MRLADRLRRTLDGPAPTPETLAQAELTLAPSSSLATGPADSPHSAWAAPRSLVEALSRLSKSTAVAHASRTSRSSRTSRGADPDPAQSHPLFAIRTEAPPSLDEALPGAAIESRTAGKTWVATTRHPLSDRHGVRPLIGEATTFTHLEDLVGDLRLRAFDPRQALYLDIEATGLEHGAGTLAFMIGLGYLDGDDAVVTQLVLREPDEERAQLELLWDLLDAFPYLVSFNGKSFDLSVLQNRLVLNRFCSPRESELKLRPHLDLLHLGKNLYRGAFTDTRLQTLERKLLGFARTDDMPGSLAPSCWFHWLREGDPRPLAAIAEHNRWDVLSMVALASVLAEVSRPIGDASRSSTVWLNLANTYARRRQPQHGLAVLAAPPFLLDPDQVSAALVLEATLARRIGDDARTCRALERLLERGAEDTLSLERALARARKRLMRTTTPSLRGSEAPRPPTPHTELSAA